MDETKTTKELWDRWSFELEQESSGACEELESAP